MCVMPLGTKQTRKHHALSKCLMDLFDSQRKKVGCNLHEYLNNLNLRFDVLSREGGRGFQKIRHDDVFFEKFLTLP